MRKEGVSGGGHTRYGYGRPNFCRTQRDILCCECEGAYPIPTRRATCTPPRAHYTAAIAEQRHRTGALRAGLFLRPRLCLRRMVSLRGGLIA